MSQATAAEWLRGIDTSTAGTQVFAARKCHGVDAVGVQFEFASQTFTGTVKLQGRIDKEGLTTWLDIPIDRTMTSAGMTQTAPAADINVALAAAAGSALVYVSPAPSEIRVSITRTANGAANGLKVYIEEYRDR
jgi:hypothetical protein